MHTITIGAFELSFEPALVSVPRDGSDYDWLCNDWIGVRHLIKIEQADGWATVTGLNGGPTEKRRHVIRPLLPTALTDSEIVDHFVQSALTEYRTREDIEKQIAITNYPWGNLVSLNWTSHGYAPGGTEYCMLLNEGIAISLGLLALDWSTIKISSAKSDGSNQ
ncbi:hypothetical protein SAMN05518865_11872 [Duganella sp. CF458]|uniref:hypothetical protein n=1 Tax=Duganella sp. CF458 TaxID=1884368 RepID=UPI0008F2BF61|nr:hypothetical protein [Duganella sp. CF458]SFG78048.1 hypothetical protein SAMN05518865_11872 [Duganella sp. CF458]